VNHTSHKADDNTNRNNLGSWAVVNMAEAADTPQMNMEEWANCHISQRAGRYWQPAFRAGQNILARLFQISRRRRWLPFCRCIMAGQLCRRASIIRFQCIHFESPRCYVLSALPSRLSATTGKEEPFVPQGIAPERVVSRIQPDIDYLSGRPSLGSLATILTAGALRIMCLAAFWACQVTLYYEPTNVLIGWPPSRSCLSCARRGASCRVRPGGELSPLEMIW